MHKPAFPPRWDDFRPGNPFEGGLPLPNFLTNPWLTSEQMATLEYESGEWAAHRAEAMIPPAYGFETVRRYAKSMVEGVIGRTLPPPPKPRGVRKVKVPTIGEELAPLVGALTLELETSLTDAALEEVIRIRQQHKRTLTILEKLELAKAVVAWAEEERVKITEEKGLEIVNKAIGRYAPVRA